MKKERITGILIIIYMIITLIASFKVIFHKEYNQYDANHDGEVDIRDMLAVQKYILGTSNDN